MNSFPVMLGGRRVRAWTPARLGAALLNWFEAVPGSLLDGSNVAVADAGTITKWIDRRDTAGSQAHASATVTGAGLTFSLTNKAVTFDGTNYLNLSAVRTLTSPYAFGIYLVAKTAAFTGNPTFCPILGSSADPSAATVTGGASGATNCGLQDSSGDGAGSSGTGNPFLLRLVGNSAASVQTTLTGGAATPDFLGGTFNFDRVGWGSFSIQPGIPADATSLIRAILVVNVDPVAAGIDPAIRAYLAGRFGVSL